MNTENVHIVCFGEILWDVYPNMKRIGGAPFNVAAHLNQLGTAAEVISRVGTDDLGQAVLSELALKKINPYYIQSDPHQSTGVVIVKLNSQGIPQYKIKESVAWDYIKETEQNFQLVSRSSAFLYGSLACRNEISRNTLFGLLHQSQFNVCDLNIREGFYSKPLIQKLISATNILKINDEEAILLQRLFGLSKQTFYQDLIGRFGVNLIIQTRGENGAEVFASDVLFEHPGYKTQVLDTVGSGDAFLAAFLDAYLKDQDVNKALDRGCKLGSFVASKSGAIPPIENHIF